MKMAQWKERPIDCKTVVFFVNVSDGQYSSECKNGEGEWGETLRVRLARLTCAHASHALMSLRAFRKRQKMTVLQSKRPTGEIMQP